MKSKYIQLPPLESHLSSEIVILIWLFAAKLSKQDQINIFDFIQETLNNEGNKNETDFIQEMSNANLKPDPIVEEFAVLMKRLVGKLMKQSCEIAGLVYQNYCIEEKSIKEISKKYGIKENILYLMGQYYDKKLHENYSSSIK